MKLTYKKVKPTNPTKARRSIVPTDQHTQTTLHNLPPNACASKSNTKQYGEQGLHNLPKTPKHQPRTTDPNKQARAATPPKTTPDAGTSPNHGIHLSPNTIRHSLRRHAPATDRPRKQRRRLSPAHGAWATQEPFTLIQADGKAISDTGTLGTERWHHLRKHRLPRYQWTFLESRTRLRLLAFRREIATLHGMAFLSVAVSGLRVCGAQTERTLQTDWGEAWGGANPDKFGGRVSASAGGAVGARSVGSQGV